MSLASPLTLPLRFYRLFAEAFAPLAPAFLGRRLRQGKEDPARLREKLGEPGVPRPQGPLVWLHGASVGETLSILPLVEALLDDGFAVLVTSGTLTSARLLAQKLPARARHQYLPLDVPRFIQTFLDHWQPDLLLIAESELWPNLIHEVDLCGVPIVLINARLSARSARRWAWAGRSAKALFSRITMGLAQSRADAERLMGLGLIDARVAGNLKYDVPALSADRNALAVLGGATAGRALWLAASTHEGDDEPVLQAHLAMRARHATLLTIIAPRHPERGGAIEAMARANGLSVACRSRGEIPDRTTQIYVADTLGELGLFYRLCPLVLIGKSFAEAHGGQNPIEPAKLGAAVLHGPYIGNFAEVFAMLDHAGGAVPIAGIDDIADIAGELLANPASLRTIGAAGERAVAELGGATRATLHALSPLLHAIRRNGGVVA